MTGAARCGIGFVIKTRAVEPMQDASASVVEDREQGRTAERRARAQDRTARWVAAFFNGLLGISATVED